MARRARGRVKAVVEKVVGDTLVVDLPAGSNEVEVEDAYVFDDVAGGMLRLGDEVLQYVEVDDDRSVVILATGTEVEHVVGEEVVVLPETTEKTALVSVGDETDVEVRVTALWHLMLPAGIRDEADQERVLLRYEADEYTLEDVWAAPKQLPGEVIFGPLPNAEIPSVTPVAPSSSPTPTVTGYAGLLQVRFDGVPNDTFVDYDIHVAATNANPPSESTLLFNTAATIEAVRELPDGTPLAYDTDYFVAVWAKSGDQYAAAPSPWVSGRMDRTRSADLAVDALDGRTITGSTFRTATSGARVEIDTLNGLVGYAPDGLTKKTQIDAVTGRINAEDGTFSGSLVGGNISIAQGVASTLDQSFETASGTTAPSGWTRTVVADTGTVTGGGVDFPTTGGNPGRRMRLRTAQVASGSGNVSHQVSSPTAAVAADSVTEFDFRWSGDSIGFSVSEDVGLALRGTYPGDRSAQVVRVKFIDGRTQVFAGGTSSYLLGDPMAINTYHRVRVTLRGNTLRIDRTPDGGSPLPTQTATIGSSSRSGSVEFYAYTSGFTGALTAVQEISVDDVHIETLQTGLLVAPDGKTTVEYLQVNQAAVVPDPILPTDAVNFRTMNTAVGNLNGNPIAFPLNSGYSMHTFGSRPYYRRVSKDFVKVGGVLTKSSGNFGTSFEDIGQLPAGFRCDTGDSQNQQFFMLGATAATTFGRARVADNGTISVQASATASYLPIDGILIDLRATRAAL